MGGGGGGAIESPFLKFIDLNWLDYRPDLKLPFTDALGVSLGVFNIILLSLKFMVDPLLEETVEALKSSGGVDSSSGVSSSGYFSYTWFFSLISRIFYYAWS